MTEKENNQDRQSVSFLVDPTLLSYFKTYAEAKSTTVTNLLTEFIKSTVEQNQTRINRYAEGKAYLMKHFNE